MSDQSTTSEDHEWGDIERTALVKFAYHLWRVDTAARSFPYEMNDHLEIMRARWHIGLVLEIVSRDFASGDWLTSLLDESSLCLG